MTRESIPSSHALLPPAATLASFEQWLPDALDGWTAPTAFTLIAGGRSNVTLLATDAREQRVVLRMPPPGTLLATAHDVVREARIIDSLRDAVPVPRVLATDADGGVAGAPFAAFEFVEGAVLRGSAAAGEATPAARAAAGYSLVDALAALHALSPQELGLSDLVREGDYVGRQLRRWTRQMTSGGGRHRDVLVALGERVGRAVPPQHHVALVHGDPKLDNCILSQDGTLRAIVDWELSAVGDPLADVALMIAYWAEPGDRHTALQDPPTRVPGFATRQELLDRYAAASGRDLAAIGSYLAFSYWKLACIVAGVVDRSERDGSMDSVASERFHRQVQRLADLTEQALDSAAGLP
ncbi:phosphotransferase family protein [uncultured Microbacterium sp.]|uniref:phosphotransferase family protein n=1 Tax=uncultured Microbacterium sp. TaxID=191216 RepID=UPI0035CB31C1